MNYGQFSKLIRNSKTGIDITESVYSYGKNIQKSSDDKIYIDGILSEFISIEKARSFIKNEYIISNINESYIGNEIYHSLSDKKISTIISEYSDVKITKNLIESYIDIAESKTFNADIIVQKIRELNDLDVIIPGKMYYVLLDENIVAINKDTQIIINKLFSNQPDIIEYMRENTNNFLHVLERIGE